MRASHDRGSATSPPPCWIARSHVSCTTSSASSAISVRASMRTNRPSSSRRCRPSDGGVVTEGMDIARTFPCTGIPGFRTLDVPSYPGEAAPAELRSRYDRCLQAQDRMTRKRLAAAGGAIRVVVAAMGLGGRELAPLPTERPGSVARGAVRNVEPAGISATPVASEERSILDRPAASPTPVAAAWFEDPGRLEAGGLVVDVEDHPVAGVRVVV